MRGKKKNMLDYKNIGYMATQYEGSMSYADCVKQAIIDEVIYTDLNSESAKTVVGLYNLYLLDAKYYDDVLMTYSNLCDQIDTMEPSEAFQLGINSACQFSWTDDYYKFDGYGNIVSYTDTQAKKEALENTDFLEWCFDCQEYDDQELEECEKYLVKYLKEGY